MLKILIGHDGSQSADAALFDLQRAGLPDEAEALIVSVADIMMVPETPSYELAGQALMRPRLLQKHIARSRLHDHEQNNGR